MSSEEKNEEKPKIVSKVEKSETLHEKFKVTMELASSPTTLIAESELPVKMTVIDYSKNKDKFEVGKTVDLGKNKITLVDYTNNLKNERKCLNLFSANPDNSKSVMFILDERRLNELIVLLRRGDYYLHLPAKRRKKYRALRGENAK